MANYEWGFDGTAEAPYYLIFNCYPYPRTSAERANLSNPIDKIILPGVKVNRGTSHRYSEDAPMMENLAQALGTIDPSITERLDPSASFGDLLGAVEDTLTGVADTYQADAFGQVTSKLGRLELLTTEAGYLGSSKRKYNFNWNLKSTSRLANSYGAQVIGEVFERNSMPVVGSFSNQGTVANASRMQPPNVWVMTAISNQGVDITNEWLGRPKVCVLMSVLHGLDNQSFISEGQGEVGTPFSYFLSCNFVELENVFNYRPTGSNGFITSRSEYFDSLGGSIGQG
tara:strand:+ start:369 stop:1223 length:855 start_codon:yes stop_codon:yes gene_type:complete